MIDDAKDSVLLSILLFVSALMRINMTYINLSKYGILYTGDTIRYDSWANQILEKGLGFYAENIDKPYYWGYASVLALFRKIFSSDMPIIIFQNILSAVVVIVIYKTIFLIFEDKTTAFIGGIIYCYFYPFLDWNYILYSDSLGVSLEIICIYLFFLQKKQTGRKRVMTVLLFAVIGVMFLLIRTTAFISLTVMTVGLINQLSEKKRRAVYISLAVCIAAVLAFMFFKSSGEHSPASRLEYYIELFRNGTVVYGGFNINIPQEMFDSGMRIFCMIFLVILRAVCFWGIAFPYMPVSEMVINTLQILPIFIFGLCGAVKDRKNGRKCGILVAVVIASNIVQAFSEVDFEFRYRIPIYPPLIIISAYFLNGLFERLLSKVPELRVK